MHIYSIPSNLSLSRRSKLSRFIKHTQGLTAYYPFDETTGVTAFNRAPATIGTLDGTITGATIGQPGKVGRSYSFDGVGDEVIIGTSFDPNYTNMTIGGICYVDSASQGSNRTLMGKSDTFVAADMRWQASINSSNLFFFGRNGSNVNFSGYGNNYPLNRFFQWSITQTPSSTILNINGVNVETLGAVTNGSDGTSVFKIGAIRSTSADFFIGKMQHNFIFNTAVPAGILLKMAHIAGLV